MIRAATDSTTNAAAVAISSVVPTAPSAEVVVGVTGPNANEVTI